MNRANFAYGTVLTAPSPALSGTTLVLGSGQGTLMPAVPFNIVIWPSAVQPLNSNAEICTVTNVSSDTLTITRAQEGTSAIAIVSGYQVSAAITAQMLADLELVVSDGAASITAGTLRFSNANGVSVGINGQTVTFSHNGLTTAAQSNHSHGNPQLNLTNLSGTTASNSAGLTLSLSAADQSVQTQGSVAVLGSTGAISFGNANGITFGGNASTVTASHNGLTSQSNQAFSAQGGSSAFQTLHFRNANGASFSNSAGSVEISYTVPTVTNSTVSLSDANSSGTLARLAFTNLNGVTLSLSTGAGGSHTIVGSHNALTTAAQSNHSHGNPTLALTNLSGTTASNSAGLTLSLSAAAPGGGGNFSAGVSNLGNTAGDTGVSGTRLVLVGSQNITLNQATDANGLTVSFSGGAGAAGNTGFISAGANTASLGTVVFSNSNGVSFGANGQTVTASHNGLTTARASNDAVGLNTALTAGPLAWTVNSNGISLNAGSAAGTTSGFGGNLISGSMTHNTAGLNLSLNHPAWLTTAMASNAVTLSNIRVSAGTTSNLLSALTFANGNGVSFGLDASTVTASHNGLTSQSNQNVTAANGGFAFQTLSFSNVNGISFGTSAGSAITASHNALTTARASNDAIGLNTAQSNVTWTVNSAGLSLDARGYAGTGTTFNGANISGSMTVNSNGVQLSLSGGAGGGGVTPVASASNGSFSFTTLAFSNANNVTFGTSAGSIITASVAAPGAAAENNNIALLGANTAGNTTASGSTIGWSGINLTLSGTNASVVNISAPATSSLSATGLVSISTNGSTISIGVPGYTHSGFNPYADHVFVAGQAGQGTLQFDPERLPNLQHDRLAIGLINTNSSNSSGSHTISVWAGLYTRNASTLSLYASTSSSTALTHSGTAGSYSLYSGIRLFTIPWTQTLTEGDYWMGFLSRTTSGGANGSYSNVVASNVNSNFLGHFGSSHNTTQQLTLGQGVYSATTSGLPGSVAFSQIRGSDSQALRAPMFMLASGTV